MIIYYGSLSVEFSLFRLMSFFLSIYFLCVWLSIYICLYLYAYLSICPFFHFLTPAAYRSDYNEPEPEVGEDAADPESLSHLPSYQHKAVFDIKECASYICISLPLD